MGSSARRISSGCRKRQTAGIKEKRMHYCGDFRTTYRKDMEIFQTPFIKVCLAVFLGFLLVLPALKLKGEYLLKGESLWILLPIPIASIGAAGINILPGHTR